MSSNLRNTGTEISVFLKCQNCHTFITSPLFSAIKRHFDKCQQTKEKNLLTRISEKNDIIDNQHDAECDLIDDEMETITFSKPFVLLQKCVVEHSEVKPKSVTTKRKQTLFENNKRKLPRQSQPVPGTNDDLPETSPVQNESKITGVHGASELPPRKSRLKALQQLSKVVGSEERPEHNSSLDRNADDDWNSSAEDEEDNHHILTKKLPKKRKLKKPGKEAKDCCGYDNPACPFVCDLCPTRYNTADRLASHQQSVHQTTLEVFSCLICSRMFNKRLTLQAHFKAHENAEISEKNFETEIKDEKTVLKCKFCLMPHPNRRALATHMTSIHPDKGHSFKFQCPYTCSSRLNSIKELMSHFKSNHRLEYYGNEMTWDRSTRNSLPRGRPKQKCDDCGKMFEIYYLAAHKARYHSEDSVSAAPTQTLYKCPFPGCPISCKSVAFLKGHFIPHLQNNPYVCTFPGCSVKLDNPYHLKRHIKRHLDVPPICTECGVSYANEYKFKKHNCGANVEKQRKGQYKLVKIDKSWRLKRVRGKDEDFDESSPADKVTPTVSIIKIEADDNDKPEQHEALVKKYDINSIIMSDPVFIQACKDSPGFGELLLGYGYFDKDKDRSSRSYTLRTYKCSRCPTVFESRHGYMEHQKLCADGDGESCAVGYSTQDADPDETRAEKFTNMQIGCPSCGKPFPDSDALKTHLSQDHTADEVFQCEEPNCGRYFPNPNSKLLHFQRYHKKVSRPFQCTKCGGKFITEGMFHQHMERHRSDPLFRANKTPPCEVCGKVLVNLHSRRRHMKLQHGITVPVPTMEKNTAKKKAQDKPNVATQAGRRSGRHRVPKRYFNDNLNTPELELQQNDEVCVQIKIEPDVHILPDAVNQSDDSDAPCFDEYDTIGKYETEDHLE